MHKFFDNNFGIEGEIARQIYGEIKSLPIFDYHSHLDAKAIFEDKPYNDLFELWLASDHYKWRLMRQAGVDERYITGDASPKEKFLAFARILPLFVGNPVYEWAHLELRKYFDLSVPISAKTQEYIWNTTSDLIKERRYSPYKLLKLANVDTVITTDEIIDDLSYHQRLAKTDIKILPTFRADRLFSIDDPLFNDYIKNLSASSNVDIYDMASLNLAVENRLKHFSECGSPISDISLLDIPKISDLNEDSTALKLKLEGKDTSSKEIEDYKGAVIIMLARLFKKYGFAMQLHIGALRNQNTRKLNSIGKDSGIDSIGAMLNIDNLGRFLDILNSEDNLPPTIIYTHNENSYYEVATMLGNFAGEGKGKLQLGPAWWMMDSRDGIKRQLEVFKNTGGIGYFNGMLTDSRSFTSFVRHDYFRRILSSFLGKIVEEGGAIFDEGIIEMSKNISYYNAKNYFSGGDKI